MILAPVCNPTLQVIGLHRPCVEKAGVAVNALRLYLTLNINSHILSLKADIYLATLGTTFIL